MRYSTYRWFVFAAVTMALGALAAAREIMAGQTYCALITQDSAGRPQVRTMNPFPPEADMSVWMATNSRSRKVEEIRNNPRVSLYYANHKDATGTVIIHGEAVLVDDMEEKLKRKRAYWDQSFPDWSYLMLIKVVPSGRQPSAMSLPAQIWHVAMMSPFLKVSSWQ